MNEEFESNVVRQRQSLRLTQKEINRRIQDAPFGDETKNWARRWADVESYGNVGFGLYNVTPIMTRGEGAYLYDTDGKCYIDLLAGFSVSSLGTCNEEITKIIHEQSLKLIHYFDFPHVERIKLAEKLVKLSRIENKTRVVFGVSGSDGIELAIRAARYYTGQPYILSPYGDYHGNTYGTMGLTGKGGMQPYFYPVLPNMATGHFYFPYCYRCPFDKEYPDCRMFCMTSFERLLESKESPFGDGISGINNVAAILVEPFQSSAGYYIPPVEYLQELRRITEKFGMLLIVDEIQSGLGRSGKLWAFEHSEIEPDMIVTSKALGGGVPISAVIGRSEIFTQWGPGANVSTQAGNVLACAAGNYVLDTVSSKEFLTQVNEVGSYFNGSLQDLQTHHPIIGHINSRGIYTGLELVCDRKTKKPAVEASIFIRDRLLEEGVLYEKGGYYHNRMQFIPPLTIGKETIDRVINLLDRVFGEAEGRFLPASIKAVT
jgi:4-aminobutyrate aminotransferase-like enzyme